MAVLRPGSSSPNMPVSCSLVINVSPADVPIVRYTVPHILSSHKISFSDVVLVVDEKPLEGRIATQVSYPIGRLYEELKQVREQRPSHPIRVVAVDYSGESISSTLKRWFGHDRVALRCAGGTPIYAFLFGLDQALENFRLHLDSDMLSYDPGPRSWVEEAIEIIRRKPKVLFVAQFPGPYAPRSPEPLWVAPYSPSLGVRATQGFSTRCFLFSWEKLRSSFLPLRASRHPLPRGVVYRMQGRSPFHALEKMFADRLAATGTYRCDLEPDWGFNLHAWDKMVFNDPRISEVVKLIAAGRTPESHAGQPNLEFWRFLR